MAAALTVGRDRDAAHAGAVAHVEGRLVARWRRQIAVRLLIQVEGGQPGVGRRGPKQRTRPARRHCVSTVHAAA